MQTETFKVRLTKLFSANVYTPRSANKTTWPQPIMEYGIVFDLEDLAEPQDALAPYVRLSQRTPGRAFVSASARKCPRVEWGSPRDSVLKAFEWLVAENRPRDAIFEECNPIELTLRPVTIREPFKDERRVLALERIYAELR